MRQKQVPSIQDFLPCFSRYSPEGSTKQLRLFNLCVDTVTHYKMDARRCVNVSAGKVLFAKKEGIQLDLEAPIEDETTHLYFLK